MRKTSPISVIAAIIGLMIATNFAVYASGWETDSSHSPRDGDLLHPAISFSRNALHKSENIAIKGISISTQFFSSDDSNDAAVYIDGDTVSYVQFATKHRFLLSRDTLRYCGFENRATSFILDSPVAVMRHPLVAGEEVAGQDDEGLPPTVSEAARDGAIELTVSSPEGNTDIGISLSTDSGIRLGETVTVKARRIPSTVILDIPDGHKGVILIHFDSGQWHTTRKVII